MLILIYFIANVSSDLHTTKSRGPSLEPRSGIVDTQMPLLGIETMVAPRLARLVRNAHHVLTALVLIVPKLLF